MFLLGVCPGSRKGLLPDVFKVLELLELSEMVGLGVLAEECNDLRAEMVGDLTGDILMIGLLEQSEDRRGLAGDESGE